MGKKISKKQKVNYIYILMILVILILLFIIGTFVYKERVDKVNEASIILYSDAENITIDDSLPVSDKFGKDIHGEVLSAYKYLDFEVVNVSAEARDYQIFITKNDLSTNEINNEYVKFYLTDDKDNPVDNFTDSKVPSYVDLKYIKDLPKKKLLYTGKLDKYQRRKFTIKVWVTDNYVSSSENYFSFDISARAI